MGSFGGSHDAYRLIAGATQQITVTSATGNSTAVFGPQTLAVELVMLGTVSSNAAAFVKFYNIGETSQASSTADKPIPLNFPQVFKVSPGQRASLISADAAASYRVFITELTD